MSTTQLATLQAQGACSRRFKADGVLMGMIHNVWDGVPENAPLPYVAFGDHVESPWPVFGFDDADIEFVLHIYTEGPGDAECYQIFAEVKRLLKWNDPLILTDYVICKTALQTANILTDEDGITRHMFIRYRFLVEEKRV